MILVQAGAARLLLESDPARSRAAIETIEDVARDTLVEIDQLVRALRDTSEPDAVEPPAGWQRSTRSPSARARQDSTLS